ncbi:hypothetical protein HK100_002380 [Physocladia obscura]|uniref:G-protein coupled receptors family 3 profile domain-containing protein n=1 Tax=Physocladia obscura TaxID=109957 RepID=A0AAD5XAA4_9FUNG|nr:hypothetical protein HK100_002380 [Physocladia obscura]
MFALIAILVATRLSFADSYNSVPFRCFDVANTEILGSLCTYNNSNAVSYLVGDFSGSNVATSIIKIWYPGTEGVKEEMIRCAADYIVEEAALGLLVAVNITCLGWGNIVSQPMTVEDHPDMIMMGTTQLGARESIGQIQVLNSWIGYLSTVTGQIITDDFLRFFFYDGSRNGNWYALTLVTDYRLMYINRTVFDALDLMYPPPLGNWSTPYSNTWTWRKFYEYSSKIKNSKDEETKVILAMAQSSGSFMLNQTTVSDPNMPGQTIDWLQTALQNGGFVDFAENTLRPMFMDGSVEVLFNRTYPNFVKWMNTPLNPDPLAYHFEDDMNVGLTCNAETTVASIKMDGPSVALQLNIYDSVKNPTGDISVVVEPGQWGFLGGSLIAMSSYSTNQKLTWNYMTKLVDANNPYITRMNLAGNNLPPYLSAWTNPVWSLPAFDVHKLAIQFAVAPQYPMIAQTKWITYPTGIAIVLAAIAAVGILLSVILIVMLIVHKDEPIIKSTSPLFSILILIGTLLGYASVYVNIGAKTQSLCLADIWLSYNAALMILGNTATKNYCLYKICTSSARFKKATVTDLNLLGFSGAIQIIGNIILVIWTVLSAPAVTVLHPSETSAVGVCLATNSIGQSLAILIIIRKKKLHAQFNVGAKSAYVNINQAIYILTACLVIGGFVYGTPSIDSVTQLLIRLFLVNFALFAISLLLVGYTFASSYSYLGASLTTMSSATSSMMATENTKAANTPGSMSQKEFHVSVMNVKNKMKGWQVGTLQISEDKEGKKTVIFRAKTEDINTMQLISPNTSRFEAQLTDSNNDQVIQLSIIIKAQHLYLIDAGSNELNQVILKLILKMA